MSTFETLKTLFELDLLDPDAMLTLAAGVAADVLDSMASDESPLEYAAIAERVVDTMATTLTDEQIAILLDDAEAQAMLTTSAMTIVMCLMTKPKP